MARPSPPGRFLASLAAVALVALALALAGPAAGAVVPTFTKVTQEGGIGADCTAPLPGGPGAASALYSNAGGSIQANWSVPDRITPGSQVTLGLQITYNQGISGLILLNAPSDFDGSPAPFEVAGSVPFGGGSFNGSTTITFNPTRAFTPGETRILRIGNGCNAFLYEYVAQGTPDTTPPTPRPPRPQIVPRTTRPVPGAITSYAAPRPGKAVALPLPATGCGPPATSTATGTAPAAGGTCEVDVFLRRKGGGAINDPDAIFALDERVSQPNVTKAIVICSTFAFDAIARGPDREFQDANDRYLSCLLVVARILQRADDLKAARGSHAFVPHAAHACEGRVVRLRLQPRRAAPVIVACRHTATRTRLTLRARRGAAIGGLIAPSSRLIIGRSDAVPFRPGDRIDVRWTVTPPAG